MFILAAPMVVGIVVLEIPPQAPRQGVVRSQDSTDMYHIDMYVAVAEPRVKMVWKL